jgi:hypothetical protein
MAVTTNYSWSTPDNTSYVKDGASSIRTLGSSVDTTLFTALGGAYPGLRLISSFAVSASSGYTISNVFTSTYTNYRIIIDGWTVSSSGNDTLFQLVTGGTPAGGTSYKWTRAFQAYTSAAWNTSASTGTSSQPLGWVSSTVGQNKIIDVFRPQVAGFTQIMNNSIAIDGTFLSYGQHEQATSYDGFKLVPDGAFTMSGTVKVYGYAK